MPTLAVKEYCTGCTACASVCPKGCITMAADENGFLFPVVDTEKCVSCGLCEKVCPIITPLEKPVNEPAAYAAYSRDEAIRLSSSSGGVFTEFARAVLKDGGAVFGAAYNDVFEVSHICAENEADLARLRGAKYAQSALGDSFRDVKRRLEQGQKVLFSGTPCQVLGLKSFLHRSYDNLLLVDMVCHSVPSPMAWREYVKYRAHQDNGGAMPKAIDLRDKQTGWTNYRYSNLFTYADGYTHAVRSGESLYMKLFGGGYITSTACTNCPAKGYARVSDLTIGDFWGIWDVAPEMDDNKGTSVVLLQSQRGAEIFSEVSEKLIMKEVSLAEASRQNQAMLVASKVNAHRQDVLKLIREGKIDHCERVLPSGKVSSQRSLKRCIGRVLSRIGLRK